MDFDPNRYAQRHPEVAAYISPGEHVELRTIDEPTDVIGEPFLARVEGMTGDADYLVEFRAAFSHLEQAERVSRDLMKCVTETDCNLHIVAEPGIGPGAVLVVQSPAPLEEFPVIHIGTNFEGKPVSWTYHLRFHARLIL